LTMGHENLKLINQKFEIRNPKQNEAPNSKTFADLCFEIGILNLLLISCFGFRIFARCLASGQPFYSERIIS
jgi:hypothetical protein